MVCHTCCLVPLYFASHCNNSKPHKERLGNRPICNCFALPVQITKGKTPARGRSYCPQHLISLRISGTVLISLRAFGPIRPATGNRRKKKKHLRLAHALNLFKGAWPCEICQTRNPEVLKNWILHKVLKIQRAPVNMGPVRSSHISPAIVSSKRSSGWNAGRCFDLTVERSEQSLRA